MPAENDLSSIPIRVLVVDDDEAHAQSVADSLEGHACECTVAASGKHAMSTIESEAFDVVITDLMMDEFDGIDILQRTKEELPQTEVILLTGHGSINSAVKAMQYGAFTYLTKPLDVSELRAAVEKAAKPTRLIRRNAELKQSLDEKFGFEGVIGHSAAMHKVVTQLKAIAPADITVLILGENGTGKELVARAIHQNSPRKGKPFVPLNISAVPESILESELFGHEKGAFTSADNKRIGKFEYANGGTLFLDEVGEMPMETQIKLLRVLEERKVTRLGANDEIDVNVRLVAATNADMDKLVAAGKFRKDLFYRLNSMQVILPPLRDRKEDIPLLMEHFKKELCERTGKEVQGFSRAARQALVSYHWDGNIRQLRNTIERMVVLDMDGLLDVDGLPDDIAALVTEESGDATDHFVSGSDSLIGRP
ncbi:MAG: sigma-54 dependent transcriptional regulator, partial [Planctomycetota bacterium]|nr:sigma-54 dependent transcriptional regulator [Planctomycetota bacterium]